jgi:hypothetical protein
MKLFTLSRRAEPSAEIGATMKRYHESIARPLPTIGAIRLQDLTALDLDRAYGELLDWGRASRTDRASNIACRRMLTEAVRIRKVARSVSEDARPPRAKAARAKQVKVWSLPETERFLAAIEKGRDHAAFTYVKRPKSDAGRRVVELDPELVPAVRS